MPRVIFSGSTDFQTALRKRIDAYFSESGRRRRDSWQLYLKAAAILSTFVGAYVLLVFFVSTWWLGVPMAVLLGLSITGIGFNLVHDGGHEAFSRSRFVNWLSSCTLDMVGGSSYLWRWKHGVFHHTYPNLTGQDTDVAMGCLARFTPHQPRYGLHRWQHWYVWGMYGAMAAKWHLYDDFHDLIVGKIGPHRIPRPKRIELATLIGGKLLFFKLAFGLPMLFHPVWVVVLFYGLVALVVGTMLSIVFQLAHCVEEASFPLVADNHARLEVPWAVHQVQTTVNFSRNRRILTWLLGGLNYQVEHHLFPHICHSHYPAISRLVQETCREFGIAYQEHRSFWAGIASHYRWLRRMGEPITVE